MQMLFEVYQMTLVAVCASIKTVTYIQSLDHCFFFSKSLLVCLLNFGEKWTCLAWCRRITSLFLAPIGSRRRHRCVLTPTLCHRLDSALPWPIWPSSTPRLSGRSPDISFLDSCWGWRSSARRWRAGRRSETCSGDVSTRAGPRTNRCTFPFGATRLSAAPCSRAQIPVGGASRSLCMCWTACTFSHWTTRLATAAWRVVRRGASSSCGCSSERSTGWSGCCWWRFRLTVRRDRRTPVTMAL